MVVKFKVFIIKLFKATKTEGLNTTKSPETTDYTLSKFIYYLRCDNYHFSFFKYLKAFVLYKNS